jgi:hypothetical protein
MMMCRLNFWELTAFESTSTDLETATAVDGRVAKIESHRYGMTPASVLGGPEVDGILHHDGLKWAVQQGIRAIPVFCP